MTNNPSHPSNMRSYMEILDEASLADVASSFGNAVKAAVGDKKARGTEQAKRLARFFEKGFKTWLGQAGKEPTEENVMRYLVAKVGFTAANARKIMSGAGVKDPTKNESIMEDLNSTDLSKIFLKAAQFAYEYDLVTPEDDGDKKGKSDRAIRNRRTSSRYDDDRRFGSRSRPEDDFIKAMSPKEVKNADKEVLQRLMPLVYKAGLEDDHMLELADAVKATKGDYSEIKKRKDAEDVQEMLARLGYAYMRSQQKD